MSKQKIPGAAEAVVHTSVTLEQRDCLNLLARLPGMTESKTVAELVSRSAAIFLRERVYLREDWAWTRPSGYYRYVDAERIRNEGWVAFHARFIDFRDEAGIQFGLEIVKELSVLAATVPRQHGKDFGLSCVVHSLVKWTCEDLHAAKLRGLQVSLDTGRPSLSDTARSKL